MKSAQFGLDFRAKSPLSLPCFKTENIVEIENIVCDRAPMMMHCRRHEFGIGYSSVHYTARTRAN